MKVCLEKNCKRHKNEKKNRKLPFRNLRNERGEGNQLVAEATPSETPARGSIFHQKGLVD